MNYKIAVIFTIVVTLPTSIYSNIFAIKENLIDSDMHKNNNDILITKLLAKILETIFKKPGPFSI